MEPGSHYHHIREPLLLKHFVACCLEIMCQLPITSADHSLDRSEPTRTDVLVRFTKVCLLLAFLQIKWQAHTRHHLVKLTSVRCQFWRYSTSVGVSILQQVRSHRAYGSWAIFRTSGTLDSGELQVECILACPSSSGLPLLPSCPGSPFAVSLYRGGTSVSVNSG